MFVFVTGGAYATRYEWNGTGDLYYTTSGNWTKMTGNGNDRFLRSKPDSAKKTVKFNTNTSISYKLSVESAGTSSSSPYIFQADSDTTGLSSSGNLEVGTYKVGHLSIQCGKFQFNQVNVGGGNGTSGDVLVIGGSDNNATLTATGKVSINNEKVLVKTNGKLICKGWMAAGNADNKSGTLIIDGGEVQHTTANYLTIGDTASSTGYVNIKNGGRYSNTGSSANGICVGQKNVGTLEINNGIVDLGTKNLFLCDNTNGKASISVYNEGIVEMKGIAYGTGSGGATITLNNGTLKARQDNAEFIPAYDALNIYIAENGATIDAGGFNITISENLQDKAEQSGKVHFTGGGMVALTGSVGWTGGTTLDAGTSLGVTTENKDKIFNDLTVVIPAEGVADSSIVLTNISDEVFFTQTEVEQIKLTGTQDGRYSCKLMDSGKTIVISDNLNGEYVWNGGDSAQSWKTDGKWSKNGSAGNWYDSTVAVFENPGDAVTVDTAVAAASIDFRANATVSGEGTLSASEVIVAPSVSTTISAPTSGSLEKTGAGALILSAPREEQTTLSEGTLIMSGENATVEPEKLTLGTNPEKPVVFDYGGKTLGKNLNVDSGLDVTLTNGTFSLDRVANGTLRVATDAVLNSKDGGWGCVGPSSSSGASNTRAFLDVCGGIVNINTQVFPIGDFGGDESSAEVRVHNGGFLDTKKEILIGNRAAGTLTIDDGYVATASGMSVVFASNAECVEGRDCVLNLNEGGELATATLRYGEGSARATVVFNGGTLKSLLNNWALIQQSETGERITALVKAGGGMIDANGHTVRMDVPLLEDVNSTGGGMTFKGGGIVTLASGNTYTGKTTVEVGTTVHVPSPNEIGSGLEVSLPEEPRDGTYTLLVCDGDGIFTDDFLSKVQKSDNTRLILLNGGKAIVCIYGENPGAVWIGGASGSLGDASNWANGAVPQAGTNCVIVSYADAELENPEGSTFAASTITIPSGSASIKISGEKFSGIAQIVNNSANVVEFENEVEFSGNIDVIQNTGALKFVGGVKGVKLERKTDIHGTYSLTVTGTHNEQEGTVVKSDGVYKLLDATFKKNTSKAEGYFSIEEGGMAVVKGALIDRTGSQMELLKDLKGTFKVNGELKVRADGATVTHYLCGGSKSGDFCVNSLRVITSGVIVLPDNTFIGSQIVRGAGYVRVWNSGSHLVGSYGDWKMYYHDDNLNGSNPSTSQFVFYKHSSSSSWSDLTFNTTDYYDPETARTITSEAPIGAADAASAEKFRVAVKGKGRFVFANTSNGNIFSGGLTVKDAATVEVKKNSWPGKGAVNLQDSATLLLHTGGADARIKSISVAPDAKLEIAESGSVKLGGNLTLENGATIKFNFTDKNNPPVLVFGENSVSVQENGQVKIDVSAQGLTRPASGVYKLTSGLTAESGFLSGSVVLAENAPAWARRLTVSDTGDILLDVSVGTKIIIR